MRGEKERKGEIMRKHMHTRETTEGAHVKVVDPIRETVLTSGGPKEARPFLRMADPPHDLIGSSLATRPDLVTTCFATISLPSKRRATSY